MWEVLVVVRLWLSPCGLDDRARSPMRGLGVVGGVCSRGSLAFLCRGLVCFLVLSPRDRSYEGLEVLP